MAHEVETMAYANEVPWHGLGQKVSNDMTPDQMLVAAGLDWKVEMRPMFVQNSDGSFQEVKSKNALVRSTDNRVLTVASPGWKPFQNRDALEFFREYTEAGGATLETAGSLRNGNLIWALAKINRDFTVNGKEDHNHGYILLSSPHKVGERIKVRTTATRVVCANTFAMAERDAISYAQNHLTEFNKAKAQESIQLAVDQISKLEREANLLAAQKISEFDAAKFYAQLLQPVDLESDLTEEDHVNQLLNNPADQSKSFRLVMDSYHDAPGATPGNLWGVFNGVTHWADHTAGRDEAGRLYSAWFGTRSEIKQKAYSQLLEMAA